MLIALACGSEAARAASIRTGIPESAFVGATTESFSGPETRAFYHDYGNGLVLNSLGVGEQYAIHTGSYGLGYYSVTGGRNGPADGYYAVAGAPTSFSFLLPTGTHSIGFAGAEAVGGLAVNDGVFDIEFYDPSDELIEVLAVSTIGVFAWDQFHGFSSDRELRRIRFVDSGHMVLDDFSFTSAVLPEASTALLFGAGIALAVAARRPGRRRPRDAIASEPPCGLQAPPR